jgi:hypothetical protein
MIPLSELEVLLLGLAGQAQALEDDARTAMRPDLEA